MNIKNKYIELVNTESDINEHLRTLYMIATNCDSIIELGVRGCVSSWAFMYGLLNNNSSKKIILLNDITECDINELLQECSNTDIDIKYIWGNDLQIEIDNIYDMTFIDTWHVYGQLKRELNKYSRYTKKYIVLHDTTIDAEEGETLRKGINAKIQSKLTGIPRNEIVKGLWPAVLEFIDENKSWKLIHRYMHNNGLTVLGREKYVEEMREVLSIN